jgi:hypothetical protein
MSKSKEHPLEQKQGKRPHHVCFLVFVLGSGLLRALTEDRRETTEEENVAGGDESSTIMKVELDGKQYLLRTKFHGKNL